MSTSMISVLLRAWLPVAPRLAVATKPPPVKAPAPQAPPKHVARDGSAWKKYLLGLVIGVISAYLYLYGTFDRAEYSLHNFNYEIRGPVPVNPDIAIVAIDDKSLKEIPEIYPWPRSYFARVVNKLHEARAKAVVFDMVFASPDRQDVKNDKLFAAIKADLSHKGLYIVGFNDVLDRFNIQNDKLFADAIKAAKMVVLGRTLSYEHQQSTAGSLQIASLQEPIQVLRNAAYLGRVDTPYDDDGQMRHAELVRSYGDQGQLTLEAMGLKLYNPGRFKELMDRFPPGEEFFFDYAGPPHTIPTYSFSEVISNDANGKPLIDPKNFTGKVVFVGATAAILHDNFPAPFLMGSPELLPGVEMHANQLNTMLTDRFVTRASPLVLVCAIILLCMAMQALLLRIRPVRGALTCAALILAYYLLTLFTFTMDRVWIDQIAPMSAVALVYFATLFTHYRSEEQKKKMIQSSFSQYLAPAVVDKIVSTGQMPETGGEKVDTTLMFSDLAGFTSISENLEPAELVDLINEYLDAMTEEILKEEGTVDKYEGDAIMTFWGAPIPQSDHAKRTCRAALQMQKRMAALIKDWHSRGNLNYEFGMRIGINSGPVIVGNMGSKRKLNYTAMGDTVNLASRLEPVNKQYGTDICISEFTRSQIEDDFVLRELDSIRVKGKLKPVVIYELISLKSDGVDANKAKFLDHFAQGLRHYKSQQWDKAIQSFEQALLINAKDHASLMYIGRCQEFKASAPPADWDGVFVMTHK